MANNPNKVKDPTEVALSAIQEALNINDAAADDAEPGAAMTPPPIPPARAAFIRIVLRPAAELRPSGVSSRRMSRSRRRAVRPTTTATPSDSFCRRSRRAGRPAASTGSPRIFAAVWIVGCGLLTFAFLPSLQAAIGQGGGVLVLAGLAALFFAPVLLFYFVASIAWRGQELRMIAQAMAQVAIRFSEPEGATSDSMVTVGQAIRREVAAMGDGVERAIARAGELETLVANEVAALERAYTDNEVRIRALLQDIAHQRDNLVGQAEQVRSAISGVQIDLRHDIALISDAIASRVDEVAKSITGALEERGAHITAALGNAGDNMILALGERGGELLDRLEEASAETTALGAGRERAADHQPQFQDRTRP